ncbi:hypothetical protein ACFU7D_08240 [Nocardioides sp. NPDC057577]|uniref:hypothetical protein n=1 Tax=Nocardioides sp. NPDC057577 TaxID=3346171 RepID=UPI00366DA72E
MAEAEQIVITLSAPELEMIRELVADGTVHSVADFVQRAVGALLSDVEAGGDMSAEALETGEVSDELAQALDEITTLFQRNRG